MADREFGILLRAKGAAQAAAGVKSVDSAIGKLSSKSGVLGSSLGTLKGRISGLAGAIGPLVGVGGLLGVTSLLGNSIREAASFGANVAIVAKTTGLATDTASAMVDMLDKWGVSADKLLPMLGKLEKNVGALGAHAKTAAAFQKAYGINLLDSSGKIADANTLLIRSADYWNGSASASEKAVVMSKLWGKTWQDMVPILSKGSAFIRAQEADAIHLTAQQMDNMAKFRDAQRDFADAFGDVEVKVGAELMPLLTSGMVAVSSWLDAHGDEVAGFFHNAATMAGQAAGAIIHVFGAVQAGWNTVPAPLRDLLVGGFVANKTVKFLFGFDPAHALFSGMEKILVGAVGQGVAKGAVTAGLGKLFVQPVFVTNPGFGAAGGLAGDAAGAAAGAGGVSLAAVFAAIVAIPAAIGIANVEKNIAGITDAQQQYLNTHGQFGNRHVVDSNGTYLPTAGSTGGLSPDDRQARNDAAAQDDARESRVFAGAVHQFSASVMGLANANKGIATRESAIARLIATVKGGNRITKELAAANKTAKSTESMDKKIADLKTIDSDLRAHGDRTAHLYVLRLIRALNAKKLSMAVQVDTFVRISARDAEGSSSLYKTFNGAMMLNKNGQTIG